LCNLIYLRPEKRVDKTDVNPRKFIVPLKDKEIKRILRGLLGLPGTES